MKAIHRDTRVKMAHNPTGELVKLLTPVRKKRIAVQLARFARRAKGFFRKSCCSA